MRRQSGQQDIALLLKQLKDHECNEIIDMHSIYYGLH